MFVGSQLRHARARDPTDVGRSAAAGSSTCGRSRGPLRATTRESARSCWTPGPPTRPRCRTPWSRGSSSRQNRLLSLLQAIDKGQVPASALDSSRTLQLTENSDQSIRDRARALLTTGPSRRIAAKWSPATPKRWPSPATPAGEKRSTKTSGAKCHRLQGTGLSGRARSGNRKYPNRRNHHVGRPRSQQPIDRRVSKLHGDHPRRADLHRASSPRKRPPGSPCEKKRASTRRSYARTSTRWPPPRCR